MSDSFCSLYIDEKARSNKLFSDVHQANNTPEFSHMNHCHMYEIKMFNASAFYASSTEMGQISCVNEPYALLL